MNKSIAAEEGNAVVSKYTYSNKINIWKKLSYNLIMIGVLSLCISKYSDFDNFQGHAAISIIIGFFIVRCLYIMLKEDLMIILVDMRIVFVSSYLLYFVIGSLQFPFGSPEGIDKSLNSYPVNDAEALYVDSINSIGVGVALFMSTKHSRFLLPSVTYISSTLKSIKMPFVFILVTALGLISELKVVAYDLDYSSIGVISGIWRALGNLLLVSILLGTIYKGPYSNVYFMLAVLMTAFSSFFGFLLFNKSKFILPFVILIAGISLRMNSFKGLVFGVIVALFALSNIGGLVAYARVYNQSSTILNRIGTLYEATEAKEKGHITGDYYTWSRLNYLPADAAAIDLFRNGNGGNDHKHILWTFIPRFLAPMKPIMTSTGTDFYFKMTGHDGSSSGQGIFVNGFYNLGWLGVLVFSSISGWIVGVGSTISREIYVNQVYILFPLIFHMLRTCFYVNGTMLSSYLGAFVMIVYGLILARIILPFLSVGRSNRYLISSQ